MNRFLNAIKFFALVSLVLILCCSCAYEQKSIYDDKEQENIYEGKECIECGAQATTYVSGGKNPLKNMNDRNSEYVMSAADGYGGSAKIYRFYYCDNCLNDIPVATWPF